MIWLGVSKQQQDCFDLFALLSNRDAIMGQPLCDEPPRTPAL